jgi:hypothetical protein
VKKRIKYDSFRVSDEVYSQIERAAVARGEEPNNCHRNIALTAPREQRPPKIATNQGRAFLEENICESLEVRPRSPVYRIKRIECRLSRTNLFATRIKT